MTSLSKLIKRGIAEERYELVSLFRNEDGSVRAELWSQPGFPQPRAGETEIGGYFHRYSGLVVCIQLHYGRWIVAREEIPRLVSAIQISP
jgi:hypothetical protein